MSDEIVDVKVEHPRTVVLQGEPGAGKSMMAGLTAVNKPVHFIDVDRKMDGSGWAQTAINNGRITVHELAEPIDESNFKSRIASLVGKKKPDKAPEGWYKFAEYMYELPKTKVGRESGTWVIDSATLLNEHLKTHIMYLAERSKFTFDQWNALKVGWMDTFSILRDSAKKNQKDIIITVHERFKEEPGDKTTGMKVENVVSAAGDVTQQKTYIGTQDIKVWASIDGAFGDLIGAQANEYYWLHVEVDRDGKPTWKCRIKPDGRRALRTSFVTDQIECEPDFRKIWK